MQFKCLAFLALVMLWGCRDRALTTQDLEKSMANAELNTIPYVGRFVSIKRLDKRYYSMVLSDSLNVSDTFVTLTPLDSAEISRLNKTGNNMQLHYYMRYNPVKKDSERMVRSMVPEYEFETSH